ncbi:MAG: hypothetical protein KC656_11210 [Myxococcales bacterium]|nr:hypothetical protein [Myxococcales bacterium]MCB9669669.1 hypothetical protein [Alphaproteobacteria bacterium]
MVRAMGFSQGPFNPHDSGRLCRGRERWIDAWEAEGPEEEEETVERLVVSGAAFSDMSAADAVRGLTHAGVDPATLITTLFPRKSFLAFMEDGHPADIPEEARGVELYDGYRAGGRVESALVRWYTRVSGVKGVRALLAPAPEGSDVPPAEDRLRGFLVLDGAGTEEEDDALFEAVFPLVGLATRDSPPARFQPAALPELVQRVRAVILVHRDKHGLAVGIYTHEPLDALGRLEGLAEKAGCLLVPFAIPPMLARWDRALSELREEWDDEEQGDFPVPEPEGGYSWENRRRRRRDRRPRGSAGDAPGL